MFFWSVRNFFTNYTNSYTNSVTFFCCSFLGCSSMLPLALLQDHAALCSQASAAVWWHHCFRGLASRQSGAMSWKEGSQPARGSLRNCCRDQPTPAAEVALGAVCPLCPPPQVPWLLEFSPAGSWPGGCACVLHFKVLVWIRAACAPFYP